MSSAKAQVESLKAQITEAKKGLLNGETALAEAGCTPKTLELKVRRMLKGHFGKVYAMHWAGGAQSDNLVSASQDGKLIVWNASTSNKRKAIPLRSSWVMTCAFERTGNNWVACGGLDNLCTIYDASDDESKAGMKHELAHHDGYLSCCRFLDENQIITSSGDSTCILWDVGQETAKSHFSEHSSDVMSISLSPVDKNLFVSGSCDAKCILWDIRANSSACEFAGHESDINSVQFFPDGNSFGTGSDDSSCRLFDIRAYNQVNCLEQDNILCGVTSVAFSSSGRFIFAGYDDYHFASWDVCAAGDKGYMKHQSHDNRVSCLGTEVSGMGVCTGSWDTILKVWA